ncbi:hypothetical protein [Clostridium sp. UBA5119]|uniref:hypothetical protein n=1 Tax=Clostridium sp. UBA5119 TaxID=1946366 RepID=UPI0032173F59
MHVIGAIRSDTAIYDLKPLPTGKHGRPCLRGRRIDYKTLQYIKKYATGYILLVLCTTKVDSIML